MKSKRQEALWDFSPDDIKWKDDLGASSLESNIGCNLSSQETVYDTKKWKTGQMAGLALVIIQSN